MPFGATLIGSLRRSRVSARQPGSQQSLGSQDRTGASTMRRRQQPPLEAVAQGHATGCCAVGGLQGRPTAADPTVYIDVEDGTNQLDTRPTGSDPTGRFAIGVSKAPLRVNTLRRIREAAALALCSTMRQALRSRPSSPLTTVRAYDLPERGARITLQQCIPRKRCRLLPDVDTQRVHVQRLRCADGTDRDPRKQWSAGRTTTS